MPIETQHSDIDQNTASEPKRSTLDAMVKGWRNKCPSCSNGKVIGGYLKVNDTCPSCGEEFHHQRADDAPPYFTIFIVGHIVIPLALAMEMDMKPPLWLHAIIWAPLIIALSLYLLPRIKGALIGLQWANRMHGFGGEEDRLEEIAKGQSLQPDAAN